MKLTLKALRHRESISSVPNLVRAEELACETYFESARCYVTGILFHNDSEVNVQ